MRKKLHKGVTIIELIIYIGLLSIFMLVLLDVFITVLNARLDTESTSSLDQDSRYILTRIINDVGNSEYVYLPSSSGESGNSLMISKNGIEEVFSVDLSGNLILKDGITSEKLNGEDTEITDINFKRLGNIEEGSKPLIKVSYTIRSRVIRTNGQESQTITTTVGLR